MRRPRDWLLVPLWFVVAVAGILWGGRNTLRSLRNWSPLDTTCAEFARDQPSADWVRLHDCYADFDRVGVHSWTETPKSGAPRTTVDEVLIPLRPVASPDDRAVIVLATDRYPFLSLGSSSFERSVVEMESARKELAGPIEGLVEHTIDRSADDRADLRAAGLHLAKDFVVVGYQGRPRPWWLGAFVLSLGLGALTLLVRKWRQRRKPVELAKATLVQG
jgi:hypothetical protein